MFSSIRSKSNILGSEWKFLHSGAGCSSEVIKEAGGFCPFFIIKSCPGTWTNATIFWYHNKYPVVSNCSAIKQKVKERSRNHSKPSAIYRYPLQPQLKGNCQYFFTKCDCFKTVLTDKHWNTHTHRHTDPNHQNTSMFCTFRTRHTVHECENMHSRKKEPC